jgi:hypothetical protein
MPVYDWLAALLWAVVRQHKVDTPVEQSAHLTGKKQKKKVGGKEERLESHNPL